ncbi:MAG: hypothetical protein ACI9UT_002954 [Flavobacteriales bacterium]|jgi:hypothetical protein
MQSSSCIDEKIDIHAAMLIIKLFFKVIVLIRTFFKTHLLHF